MSIQILQNLKVDWELFGCAWSKMDVAALFPET